MSDPAVYSLEIHITYRCQLNCPNCSNLIPQAPSNEEMPVSEIERLVQETIELNYPWKRMVLHGGEPTLHSEFERVVDVLTGWRSEHSPSTQLWVCTNAFGPLTNQRRAYASSKGVILGDAPKGIKDGKLWSTYDLNYVAVNESPTDLGNEYSLGCFQSWECGIALNNRGYFECSPSASAARVFDYKGIKNLRDVTIDAMKAQWPLHCKHCGFAAKGQRRVLEQTTTKTWALALEQYAQRNER